VPADVFNLDYTVPSRQDLALAVACMRAHAKALRRVMMSSQTTDEALSRLGNTRHIEEAARRLEVAIASAPRRLGR
jgi:hypothetical protein